MNLVEVPVLFHALVMIAFASEQVSLVSVALAWTYVGLRLIHSLIYFTDNHVVHRFAVLAASNVVLLVLVVHLGLALV